MSWVPAVAFSGVGGGGLSIVVTHGVVVTNVFIRPIFRVGLRLRSAETGNHARKLETALSFTYMYQIASSLKITEYINWGMKSTITLRPDYTMCRINPNFIDSRWNWKWLNWFTLSSAINLQSKDWQKKSWKNESSDDLVNSYYGFMVRKERIILILVLILIILRILPCIYVNIQYSK